MRLFTLASAAALLLATPLAHAQQPGPTTSAGPGRITCKAATTCEVGIGTPVKMKFQVNVEALPAADKDRLTKDCKRNGKTPCIVTVQGTEMGDPMKVKAAKITWFN
jgi:hypothetical protein